MMGSFLSRVKPGRCSSHWAVLLLLVIILMLAAVVEYINTLSSSTVRLATKRSSVDGKEDDAGRKAVLESWKKVLGQPLDKVQIPTITENSTQLKPMWSCNKRESRESNKLIFNHIFKTAGSTLRNLLQLYSYQCGAGYVVAVACTGLSFDESLTNRTAVWKNGGGGRRAGRTCTLKFGFNGRKANQSPPTPNNTLSTAYLEDNHVDILGGHLPMGSGFGWRDEERRQVGIHHLVFFRDGVRKFISGVVYLKPSLTLDEVVNIVKERVRSARKRGEYYERYSSYLITPQQVAFLQNNHTHLSMQRRVSLSLQNLVDNNVIVGIVERMPESLEVIRHMIDADYEQQSMFDYFGMDKNNTVKNNATGAVSNKSRLSSAKVLEELEKDKVFMEQMKEYVKYEDLIYSFALELHTRQHAHVVRQQLGCLS